MKAVLAKHTLRIEFPEEIQKKISKLEQQTDEITKKAFQEGAKAALPIFKNNLKDSIGDTKYESRSTGELLNSVGISPAGIDNSGNVNIKIGFNEPRKIQHAAKGKRTYYTATNAMIANVLEYGKHGQPPKPFLKRSKSQSRKPFEEAAQKKFNEEVDKL